MLGYRVTLLSSYSESVHKCLYFCIGICVAAYSCLNKHLVQMLDRCYMNKVYFIYLTNPWDDKRERGPHF